MSLFRCEHLTAGYGRRSVIEDISFELDHGCIAGILGANGSGKTTLLKSICGILPHEGRCFLEDQHLEAMSARQIAQKCCYIPQRSGISIDIPVLDVVLMGYNPYLKILEHPSSAMKENALRMLEIVGLSEKEDTNYMHMSEGQKQLCILARTLISESRLLLLDEPESALDFRFRHQMLEIIHRQISEKQSAAIVSLHDPVLALNCCDKLLLLSDGKLSGVIHPATDSLDEMESQLSEIYGSVSLHKCMNRSGRVQLVMLKEDCK